tara:strand:- start:9692 stop:10909 length:1218 start_codon:yes stop_codon:yes gene_type:complete
MKINKYNLRKYIKATLLNEVTALETGQTNFTTTRYEQCPKIIVPPIFKDLFLDKIYGENPNEMRVNLSRKYSELHGSKQNAVLFEKAFSDENIDTIMGYLNDFMNIAGVPAIFCKLLQSAIDAAAEIIDLLRLVDEKEDESKIDDPQGIYRVGIRDAFNETADALFHTYVIPTNGYDKDDFLKKLHIVKEKRHLSSKAFKTTAFMCFPNTLDALINGISIPATGGPLFQFTGGPAEAQDVSNAYAQDVLVWQSILQALDNLNVLPSKIDDEPLKFDEMQDILSKTVEDAMLASTDIVFADSNFYEAIRNNFKRYTMEESSMMKPRLRELSDKLREKSNREQNLNNQNMKETFINVLKAFIVAQQNYILFELPRLHRDISKLGKDRFFSTPNIAAVIRNIAIQSQN